MRWLWAVLAVVGILVVLVIGGWIAGEMRVQNCLAKAAIKWPTAYKQADPENSRTYRPPEPAHFAYSNEEALFEAVSSCSASPF